MITVIEILKEINLVLVIFPFCGLVMLLCLIFLAGNILKILVVIRDKVEDLK